MPEKELIPMNLMDEDCHCEHCLAMMRELEESDPDFGAIIWNGERIV
jgi:hypothetical protein